MAYRYVAYSQDMTIAEGTIDVATESLAKEALRRSGYRLLSLKTVRPGLSLRRISPSFFGVKAQDVITFSRHLATLVERGSTPLAALQLLREHARRQAFKEVLSVVIQDLQQGSSLAEAVARQPQAFPAIYSRMVRVGEQTGNLEVVLRQVASYMERENTAVKKVGKAMIYPALLGLVATGVITILMTFTLPPLLEMFADFHAELPLATKLLIGFVDFLGTYKFSIAGSIVLAVGIFLFYVRRPSGRRKFDALLLKAPLFGQISSLREMCQFSRTMAISLSAGLPMPEVMDMVVQTSRNKVVRDALENVRRDVLKGRRLSTSLTARELFPGLLVQMVKVGEQAGTLSVDLLTVADSYEQELDERVNALLHLLEPCLIVVFGVIVAFIAISVILPIYSIMGAI